MKSEQNITIIMINRCSSEHFMGVVFNCIGSNILPTALLRVELGGTSSKEVVGLVSISSKLHYRVPYSLGTQDFRVYLFWTGANLLI